MTFAAEEAGQILSQDARGRVLVSRERRESALEGSNSNLLSTDTAQKKLTSAPFGSELVRPLEISHLRGGADGS